MVLWPGVRGVAGSAKSFKNQCFSLRKPCFWEPEASGERPGVPNPLKVLPRCTSKCHQDAPSGTQVASLWGPLTPKCSPEAVLDDKCTDLDDKCTVLDGK